MAARGNSTNRYHQYVACAHLMTGEGCDDRDHIEDSDLGHRYYTRDEVPCSCQGVVALRERRAWRSCDRRLSADRQGEFVERDRQPPVRRLLDRQLVVSLPNVLDEGMAAGAVALSDQPIRLPPLSYSKGQVEDAIERFAIFLVPSCRRLPPLRWASSPRSGSMQQRP